MFAESNVWIEIVNQIPACYFVDYILKILFFYMSSRSTPLSRMIFSTLIKCTSPFHFQGSVSGIFFIFVLILLEHNVPEKGR